jgi:hypothetical protein
MRRSLVSNIRWWIGKDMEGFSRGLFQSIVPEFAWRYWGISRRTSVIAEIWTEYPRIQVRRVTTWDNLLCMSCLNFMSPPFIFQVQIVILPVIYLREFILIFLLSCSSYIEKVFFQNKCRTVGRFKINERWGHWWFVCVIRGIESIRLCWNDLAFCWSGSSGHIFPRALYCIRTVCGLHNRVLYVTWRFLISHWCMYLVTLGFNFVREFFKILFNLWMNV